MRLIIAGSRSIKDPRETWELIESGLMALGCYEFSNSIKEVVSGRAAGVDLFGEAWAKDRGIPVKLMPADWSLGKMAGILRNAEMADYASRNDGALVAIWDGKSKGTSNMILEAHRRRLRVAVKIIETSGLF